jgi:hypothetical protein
MININVNNGCYILLVFFLWVYVCGTKGVMHHHNNHKQNYLRPGQNASRSLIVIKILFVYRMKLAIIMVTPPPKFKERKSNKKLKKNI